MSIDTYKPTAANRAGVITSDTQIRVYSVGGRAVEAELRVETWNDRKNTWEFCASLTKKDVSLIELFDSIKDFWTNDTNRVKVVLRRR